MAETQTSTVGGAQERSSGIVNRVKESAAAQLTTQKNRGTDALGQVAHAVRSSTQKLREERHETIAGYIDKAADQIDTWSRRLREKDIDELMFDVQRLARRQPGGVHQFSIRVGTGGSAVLQELAPAGPVRLRQRIAPDALWRDRGTEHRPRLRRRQPKLQRTWR
jgi:hypothetical protein